jgi:hypothetical protein
MRQKNMSDQEIISELRKQNISPREINEALNHALIKNAVSDIRGGENMEAPIPGGGQYDNGSYGQQEAGYDQQQAPSQDYGGGDDQNQVYTAQPQQAYYPQQQGYGDYPAQQAVNTDTIVEVSEQVFNEKISEFSKRVDSMDEFKALTQARLEHLNERLKRIEAIIDRLQSSILEKVGSYGSNLESIKKEMSMMQDSFIKVAEGKRSQHSESEEKSSKKKK